MKNEAATGRPAESLHVPDHFATLGIARAPWVDAEDVKERFFRMGAAVHPDSGGTAEAFARVNSAWLALRDPAECLRHYLELEHPSLLARASQTPAELGDLFMDIAALRQRVQALAAKLAAAPSPLARSLLEAERQAAKGRIAALSGQTHALLESVKGDVRLAKAGEPELLVRLLSTMVFLTKWARQLSESAMALEAGSAG